MSAILAPALLLLFVMALASRSFGSIILMPYLQAVTTDSVYVMVECNSLGTVTVEYGATTSYGSTAATQSTAATTASPATYVHRIKLTGLKPNTQYHYRASQGGSPTSDRTFSTAVNPGTGYRFAFMADCRTGVTIHDAISARIKTAEPRFSLYGGDLCYDSSYTMWKSEFFRANELAVISTIPFFNTPGNHEGWTTNTKAFTQAPASASGTQDYYSFDYGDVHFVCVNNMINDSVGSAQYNFVGGDLTSSDKPWKIVFYHQPAYCAGGHGEYADMVNMSTNLFVPKKVDMTFGGHSHFYQHNYVSGIHHLVIGSAGAPLYAPGTAYYTIKSLQSYCYAIIDVTPTNFHLVAYKENGVVIETIDLNKMVVPAAPSGLTAAAVSAAQVDLTWTDNSNNEVGFKIERSTDGTNYTEIHTVGGCVTSYSDTGVAGNTGYYYRVRSHNAAGNSAYSNVAEVTTPIPRLTLSIGQARIQVEGTDVEIRLGSAVTLVPPESGVFYIQDAEGTAGIRVETAAPRPAVGANVSVTGTIGTKPNGERAILNAAFTADGTGTTKVRGLVNRSVGGRGYVGSETVGLSSQGLLIRVWGKVTKVRTDPMLPPVFWIDDGSHVDAQEADGARGLKVIESGLTPTVGTFVKIVGVVGAEMKNGKMIRVIRYRASIP